MQKITIKNLKEMKESGEKIACLTSYDASFAKIQDEAGVDLLLVGDLQSAKLCAQFIEFLASLYAPLVFEVSKICT